MKSVNRAKLDLIIAVTAFGTIGIFVRYINLPSSVIAFVRGAVGAVFLLLSVVSPPDTLSVGKRPAALEAAGSFRRDHQLQLDHAV